MHDLKKQTKQKSFEHIYEQHKNRIHYYLHLLHIPYELRDKFYAEGMYALWLAYKQFDSQQGNFTTFLNYRIRFRMIDLIRKKARGQQTKEQLIKNQKITLHTGNRNRATDQPLLSYDTTIHIRDEQLWIDLRNMLTDRQWKWVYYFIILDWPLKKIAETENVSIEAVKGWAKMTRQKLRKDKAFKKRLQQAIQT